MERVGYTWRFFIKDFVADRFDQKAVASGGNAFFFHTLEGVGVKAMIGVFRPRSVHGAPLQIRSSSASGYQENQIEGLTDIVSRSFFPSSTMTGASPFFPGANGSAVDWMDCLRRQEPADKGDFGVRSASDTIRSRRQILQRES